MRWGLAIILVFSTAFAALDVIDVYRDSAFSTRGATFADGSTVHVSVHDGATSGGSRQVFVQNAAGQKISFFADWDGESYKGRFRISSSVTSDRDDVLQAADAEQVVIGAPSPVDIDSEGDGSNATIAADYTPPEITSCSFSPESWIGANKKFTAALKGEPGGSASVTIRLKQYALAESSPGDYSAGLFAEPGLVFDGKASCGLSDAAGNSAARESDNSVRIDGVAPVISIPSPESGEFLSAVSDASVTVADEGSGVAGVSLGAWRAANSSSGRYYFVPEAGLPEGRNVLTAEAVDSAGNAASLSWFFVVDTEPPKAEIVAPPFSEKRVKVKISVTDSLSPRIKCVIKTESAELGPFEFSNGTSDEFELALSEGEHSAEPRCEDLAGNKGEGKGAVFVVDESPPIVSAELEDRDGVFGPGQKVRLRVEAEDLSPVTSSAVELDGQEYSVKDGVVEFTPSGTGEFAVVATAADILGHEGSATVRFVVDAIPPEPASGVAAEPAFCTNYVSWNASPSDDVAGYNVYRGVAGGDESLVGSAESLEFADSDVLDKVEYVYSIRAVDKADNEALAESVRITASCPRITHSAGTGLAGLRSPPFYLGLASAIAFASLWILAAHSKLLAVKAIPKPGRPKL
jgi:hypothetical protein